MNFPIVNLNPLVIDWIERIQELKDAIVDEIKYNGLHPNIHFVPDWDFLQKNGEIVLEKDDNKVIYISVSHFVNIFGVLHYIFLHFLILTLTSPYI